MCLRSIHTTSVSYAGFNSKRVHKKHCFSGKIITKLLVNLHRNYEVDKENFLLVGHSLGGQICGFVGKLFQKETAETLPRLIALDPAGKLILHLGLIGSSPLLQVHCSRPDQKISDSTKTMLE